MRAAGRRTGNREWHGAYDDLCDRGGVGRLGAGVARVLCRELVNADGQGGRLESSYSGGNRARAVECSVVQQLHAAAGCAVRSDAHVKCNRSPRNRVQIR